MKKVSMSGSPRENVGKKDAKALRNQGLVPCVLYGGEKQYHFAIPEKNFGPVIFTPFTFVVELEVGGKKFNTIIQDAQYHPTTESMLHVDFLEVKEDKPVVISLPIRISGTSPGVLRGGKLFTKFRKLKVKGLISQLPELVEIKIDDLNVGDSIKVADVKIPNVELLDKPKNIVVGVQAARNMVADDPAAKK